MGQLLRSIKVNRALMALGAFCALGMRDETAHASIAYGTLNNFDCVNDTGVEAHGFDIELDDIHSKDITYTYDYNHYGVPKITEDNTDPLHPKVLVRYASAKNPDGTWAAYTAIPSGPIAPTQGHQFTDPTVNFGGEHFGVGYYGAATAVKYNWLIDDGRGNLIHGPPVNVSTPTFTYSPPVAAAPANVVAAIVPPPPPAPPVYQFGEASWVKEIKTTTHNNHEVQLHELVGDDPGQPQPWANGEPDEVEVEWRILQTEFGAADGGVNGELRGAAEDLPGGDEVITRRYEFYKYTGPIDAETGEAMADAVAADGVHGMGNVTYAAYFDFNIGEWITTNVDLSTIEVVGDFFGAQMSSFDVAPNLGLIDHLQDGELNVPYVERTVVVGGNPPYLATITSGSLPPGMGFDEVTGVLSGTPTASGVFDFTINGVDSSAIPANVTNTYSLKIVDTGAVVIPHTVVTSASPLDGGSSTGGGEYADGSTVTVVATPNPGFSFVNWTENGTVVSALASFQFTLNANRALVANFVPVTYTVGTSSVPSAGGATSGGGTYNSGQLATVTATPNSGYAFVNWTEGGAEVSTEASYSFTVSGNRALVANFVAVYAITTSPYPNGYGTTSGGGTYRNGDNVSLVSTPKAGYAFLNWMEGNLEVSTSPTYSFTAAADRTLTARFTPLYTIAANPGSLLPANGKLVGVALSVVSVDPSIQGKIVNVTMNEPPDKRGSAWVITGDLTLDLRAACDRQGTGRVYTITVECKDIAGYTSTAEATVLVPTKHIK